MFLTTGILTAAVVFTWLYGRRRTSMLLATLGLLTHIAIWTLGIGHFGTAFLGLLCIVGIFSVPEVFIKGWK